MNLSRPNVIVLYRLSTSNHNCVCTLALMCLIVLYRLSTSNHNSDIAIHNIPKLSYIVFLHQTTTATSQSTTFQNCLISSFYIKPQPGIRDFSECGNCLISSFYIKPQPLIALCLFPKYCLISSFYIKPQPCGLRPRSFLNCLISSFYIKPQPSSG